MVQYTGIYLRAVSSVGIYILKSPMATMCLSDDTYDLNAQAYAKRCAPELELYVHVLTLPGV